MLGQSLEPIAVSRRICAPAADIFELLADPKRHLDLDGSGMLRGAASEAVVSAVGDVFVMKMYYEPYGDYEMNNHVVEYERDRRIGWEPVAGNGHPDEGSPDARWGHRWSFELVPDGPDATVVTEIFDCSAAPADDTASLDGRTFAETMSRTLERLDQLCAGGPS